MYTHHHWQEHDLDDKTVQRQTSGLLGIVVILLLLVGGLFLVKQLHTASIVEDCLLTGGRNCDALVTRPD